MATYIIGDVQGCYDELQALLDIVKFDTKKDELWLTGDLVARGPKSLETLRFVKSLGKSATVILGNHDLHLMATHLGYFKAKTKDKTQAIIDAPDCAQLVDWLRTKPLLKAHPKHKFVMCHAGIYPQWSLKEAKKYSREIQDLLQSDRYPWLIKNMYGTGPKHWKENLKDIERYRFIINSFTRMRFCTPEGDLDMDCKLHPKDVNAHKLTPWFKLIKKHQYSKTIVFGHWAALVGYRDKNVIGLDTGCVWGNDLTLLRWEDQKEFKIKKGAA